ncbi:MAG: pilus assembly protein [Xanthobacteraceae bacterium]
MLLSRFFRDRKGGVAPLLALSIIPIMGAVAASVDYSRAASTRSAMQSALDSASLMLSKEAQDLDGTALGQKATDYFKATFNRPEAVNVAVTADLVQPSQGSFKLTLNGSATVDTIFAQILGKSQIDLSATSEAVWGIKKLNLSLVLDNTGSMSWDGKMDALKSAAHNLLNTLEEASSTPGDIQVSIVPFAVDVNVGTNYVNADWIDWTEWETKNGNCSKSNYKTKSKCTSNGGSWTAASHSTWNGCVADRDQNNDVQNTAPVAGSGSTMFPTHQASACPTAMKPLSYEWTALHDKIDAMTPSGNTNTTIGLAWGWQTLTPTEPLNAPPSATDLDKVIILLTDGENTQNRWTSSSSSINARTTMVCDNIKADNVRVYTVRVIEGNASLLQSCASKPSMYYDVDQAEELAGVFSSIAQNLANLRLSQ